MNGKVETVLVANTYNSIVTKKVDVEKNETRFVQAVSKDGLNKCIALKEEGKTHHVYIIVDGYGAMYMTMEQFEKMRKVITDMWVYNHY